MLRTVGQYRVGTDFNPSGDSAVARLKEKAAAFIDECLAQQSARMDELSYHPKPSREGAIPAIYTPPRPEVDEQIAEVVEHFGRAMREAESAAMWAVKAATKRPRS